MISSARKLHQPSIEWSWCNKVKNVLDFPRSTLYRYFYFSFLRIFFYYLFVVVDVVFFFVVSSRFLFPFISSWSFSNIFSRKRLKNTSHNELAFQQECEAHRFISPLFLPILKILLFLMFCMLLLCICVMCMST